MVINNIKDTIAAIATPLGTGGVGVIRISGENSFNIISRIFSSKFNEKKVPDFEAGKVYHGWVTKSLSQVINHSNNTPCHCEMTKSHSLVNDLVDFNPVDEVIVLAFKAPKSYTGEDVIEIHCHGGVNIVKSVLNLCLESGTRMAEAGEFTKRAFLNGKMDLSKAEAVLDLIHSKTDVFSSISAHNLTGKLSLYISSLRKDLVNLLSLMTAAIDFPEEVDELEYSYIEEKINFLIEKINFALNTASTSNLMRYGLKVAIVGKPNVGKSSLFNSLLNIERSIVTDIPGTTRDIIQEIIDIGGVPITLIDTAGIRELASKCSSDYIESIGINIAKACIKEADLVLFLYDSSQGMSAADKIIYEEVKDKPLVKIGTKADLMTCKINDNDVIYVSSKTYQGLDLVKKEIEKIIFSIDLSVNSDFSTNIRQQECLKNAKNSLLHALNSSKNREVQDFISIDLKSALLFLGEITGEVVSEEIINNIFSNFCIGK